VGCDRAKNWDGGQEGIGIDELQLQIAELYGIVWRSTVAK
jgi:hypothetical protein